MERLEAAVRRLRVLPERQGRIPEEIAWLHIVLRFAPVNEGYASAIDRSDPAAAKELRAAHDALYAFTRAWCGMSATAREALRTSVRSTGKPEIDIVALISARAAHVVDSMTAAAGNLEERGLSVRGPKAKRVPLMICEKAADVYERLTGDKPPQPTHDGPWTRGAFLVFLEDLYEAAGIAASAEHYAKAALRS